MTAVVTALDSTAISRLTLTRDRLKNTKNAPKVLQHLISLVQPEHNHRAYRAILGEAIRRSQDQVRKECIPWLGERSCLLYTYLLLTISIQPCICVT